MRGRGDLHACVDFAFFFFAFDFAFLFIQLLPAPGVGRCLIDGGFCLANFGTELEKNSSIFAHALRVCAWLVMVSASRCTQLLMARAHGMGFLS